MSFFQFVLDNPDKDWNWVWLSRNPNITWEFVQKNMDKPWDWDGLSQNTFGWNADRQRIIQRTLLFKDELIEITHHPNQIQKWLDNGTTIEELE